MPISSPSSLAPAKRCTRVAWRHASYDKRSAEIQLRRPSRIAARKCRIGPGSKERTGRPGLHPGPLIPVKTKPGSTLQTSPCPGATSETNPINHITLGTSSGQKPAQRAKPVPDNTKPRIPPNRFVQQAEYSAAMLQRHLLGPNRGRASRTKP